MKTFSINNIHHDAVTSGRDSDLTSQKVLELSKAFTTFAQQTAQGILEMGSAVNQAKQLSGPDFEAFCSLIKFDSHSSSIRKLAAIGEKYAMLVKHVEALPTTWTTIYSLTKMTPAELDAGVKEGSVSPQMTAKQLSQKCRKPPSRTARKTGNAGANFSKPPIVPNGTGYEMKIAIRRTPTSGDVLLIQVMQRKPFAHQLQSLRHLEVPSALLQRL